MQGLFKLGIVGSKEQMTDFIEKSQKNERLKEWVIAEEKKNIDDGLRSIEGGGLKKFLDKYRLVIENTGSGNIKGIEELADEISKISPELEVILLTQYLDSCSLADWFMYYSPSGKTEDIAEGAMISRGEEGMDWASRKELSDFGMLLHIDVERVWDYYKKTEKDLDDESKITKEMLEYFIAEIQGSTKEEVPEGYKEKQDCCDCLLEEFFYEKSGNIEYSYSDKNENLLSLAYVSRLFGEKFVENYRFIPQTFDKRFEGKVFVVSGEPDDYGREKTEELIAKFGGIVRGSVSSKTNYLIVGDYAGKSKITKAKALGTSIINADEFEKMISE